MNFRTKEDLKAATDAAAGLPSILQRDDDGDFLPYYSGAGHELFSMTIYEGPDG